MKKNFISHAESTKKPTSKMPVGFPYVMLRRRFQRILVNEPSVETSDIMSEMST